MAGEGEWPKSDGDIIYAKDVNDVRERIKAIYTGSGFDTNASGGSDDEASYEFPAISSDDLKGSDYLIITITGQSYLNEVAYGGGETKVKIQTKEIGGSYSDSMPYKTIFKEHTGSSVSATITTTNSIVWIHTLTAGEKANGVQVKIFSYTTSVANGEGGYTNGSFTNKQTVLELSG